MNNSKEVAIVMLIIVGISLLAIPIYYALPQQRAEADHVSCILKTEIITDHRHSDFLYKLNDFIKSKKNVIDVDYEFENIANSDVLLGRHIALVTYCE